MAKRIKMSAEGYKKLEDELEYLKNVKRVEVANKLKEARSFGDLSENAEYDEAKNEQGILEAKIMELEATISNAKIVADSDISVHEVGIGSYVVIKDLELDLEEKFQIVGSTEADVENGRLSEESPLGMALLKKKAGEFFEFEAPEGIIKMQLLSISK